ncbi:MAG: dephospho-CoA kinase [Oscillospiraceae bacterium]
MKHKRAMKDYIVAGLTGQSGAGKTTVSKAFKENGFSIINCDIIAKNVTRPGSKCCKALSEIFPQCFDSSLRLNRRLLSELVFGNNEKLTLLNKTIFPYIIDDIKSEITLLTNGGAKYILLDAPTLFEAGVDKLCDCIISCVAEKNIRAERIAKRDNIPTELIEKRFSSQKSENFFVENSDYIIKNNHNEEYALMQCKEIIEKIKRRFNGKNKK